jgi:fatty-acyl-CoA synthase
VRKAGSVGFPNFSIEARCVDDDDRDVPCGQIGELIFRTPAMFSGYWNQPEVTAAAFRDGWFHTGDLVREDDEGYWYIVDRKKDMFISGGENVYPAEIEHLIVKHPAVSEVAVIGIPHPKWGEVGCAAIVLKAGANATADEIIEFCRGKIAKFKIPQRVVFRGEIPRTVSAKVAKQELKRELANVDWGFATTGSLSSSLMPST